MCRLRVFILLFGSLVSSLSLATYAVAAPQNTAIPLTTSEIAKRASPSVVTIQTPTGTGSGVIVEGSGVIVTNLHVVRGDTKVSVKLANGDLYDDVSVVDVDERKDLLLLKIKAFGLTPAHIANSDQLQVGNSVVLIGSPRGLDQTVSVGIISATRDFGEGYRVFQTDAAASPGNSGGGMFNDAGDLVGIVSSKLITAENVNFAIPINYARGLISTEVHMTLVELARKYPPTAASTVTISDHVAQTAQTAIMIPTLLDKTDLVYEKWNDRTWGAKYKGRNISSISVEISAFGSLVVSQSVAVQKPKLSPNQMEQLLKLNFDRDRVKISIDSDGSLVVLNETDISALDGQRLGMIADSVALLTDDVAGLIRPSAGSSRSSAGPSSSGPTSVGTGPLTAPKDRRLQSFDLLDGSAVLRFDPSDWRRHSTSETSKTEFQHLDSRGNKDGDLYFTVIAERGEVPIATVLDKMFDIAQTAGADAKIVRRGSRAVNGIQMQWVEIEATVKGVPFAYYGYCYSGPSGTLRMIGVVPRNLQNEYRSVVEKLVSGLEITAKN